MKEMGSNRLAPYVLFGVLLILGQLLPAQEASPGKTEKFRLGLLIEDDGFDGARKGAELAVREINEKGGIDGRSLELLVRSMEGPWGKGSKQAVELIFDQEVWALVGSSQGRNAHLIEQVIAKTNVVFLSAWAGDPTLSKAYVPHFFNCVPNSEQRAESIVRHMAERGRLDRWLLVYDDSYDSGQSVNSLMNQEKTKDNPPSSRILCRSSRDFDKVIAQIGEQDADALVVMCKEEVATALSDRIRSAGIDVPIYLDLAGVGDTSGLLSSYAYDAIRVLAMAIQSSDQDPSRLREAMTRTDYKGKTGAIRFDERGNRKGLPSLKETGPEIFSFGMP